MTDRCHNCNLPLATQADHAATKPSERPDLCWSVFTSRCIPPVNSRAQVLARTADTITDAQIRALRARLGSETYAGSSNDAVACEVALAAPLGSLRRVQAHARCAELINAQKITKSAPRDCCGADLPCPSCARCLRCRGCVGCPP